MEKALQTMIDNMPAKTGKSLEEWIDILAQTSFEKHGQAVNYLKKEFNVTHGFANTIVTLAKKQNDGPQDLVANQYEGKASLLPIYQKLITIVKTFGDDVVITPKKTEVSLDRKRKFAVIRPSTKTRIDLGLKLKDTAVTDRLETSGPFGTMCTHRVRLNEVNQVDTQLEEWLLEAYHMAT